MSVLRNLRFAIGDDVPRYWHGGRKSVTTFFDNLSVFFPAQFLYEQREVRPNRQTSYSGKMKNIPSLKTCF